MKKITKTLALLSLLITAKAATAQYVATFEDLTLAPNSYNDGSSGSGDFTSGGITFNNSYNTAWGYWESGFAFSNMGDTATAPSDYMTQLYETKAGKGYAGSDNFGIGTLNANLKVNTMNPLTRITGLWITNTTYAYNSMALGDNFSKKFGDTTNSPHSAAGENEGYPDWFKLSIIGYYQGAVTDTVDFYLADFRFADNSMDYIVKDWQYVDLSALGIYTDSLSFELSSSDVGAFGMNTPAYFCVDNVSATESNVSVATISHDQNVEVYPNPFADNVTVDLKTTAPRIISVYNAFGQLLMNEQTTVARLDLDLSSYDAGVYFVKVQENSKLITKRIIKK